MSAVKRDGDEHCAPSRAVDMLRQPRSLGTNDVTTAAECTIRFSEILASDADFVALAASVACRGFTGRTDFTMARRDVHRFVGETQSLQSDASDSALLLGGWEKGEERLRLQIVRAGRSGQFAARVRITAMGPRSDQCNRVDTEFVVARDALGLFLRGLERLASDATGEPASLSGDPDAIA